MGIGDEIMASGQARTLHEKNGLPVVIVNRHGQPRWHEAWENNPRIVRSPARRCQLLTNSGGARPYIAAKTATRWMWRRFTIRPGELYLSEDERCYAAPFAGMVLIEPHTKAPGGNKAWPWERWQAVVDRAPHRFVQAGPPGTAWLRGVATVETTFRRACAVLAAGRAFVGTEGALHHAAAALGVSAVVLWSEFIDPSITGYGSQLNIRHAGEACGSRVPCDGCRAAMAAITVDEVLANLAEVA